MDGPQPGFGLFDWMQARKHREPIPVDEWQVLDDRTLEEMKLDQSLEFGSDSTYCPQVVVARITGTGSAPLYDWQEVSANAANAALAVDGHQMTGSASALEINGNANVPVGTFVLMIPSCGLVGEGWLFSYLPSTLTNETINNLTVTQSLTETWDSQVNLGGSNLDPWNPPSSPSFPYIPIKATANITVNGISGGASGLVLTLINTGSFNITIGNNAAGTAANSILTSNANSIVIYPGQTLVISYDPSATKWRTVGGTAMSNFTSTQDGTVPASGGGTTNFLRADGTWAAAGGGNGFHAGGNYYHQIGVVPKRWYLGGMPATAQGNSTSGNIKANILYALPFADARGGTLNQIAVYTSLGAGNVRLGIYNNTSDTNLYPGSLLVDAGAVALPGGGGIAALTISQSLTAGALYWLVVLGDSSSATAGITVINNIYCTPILGYNDATMANGGIGWTVSQTYGALPGTFPASATVMDSTDTDLVSSNAPAIGVHFSA